MTDPETLERAAAGYRAEGWPAQVEADAFTAPFSAPGAGPPPWRLCRFTFRTAVGVATTEPSGAPAGDSAADSCGGSGGPGHK